MAIVPILVSEDVKELEMTSEVVSSVEEKEKDELKAGLELCVGKLEIEITGLNI